MLRLTSRCCRAFSSSTLSCDVTRGDVLTRVVVQGCGWKQKATMSNSSGDDGGGLTVDISEAVKQVPENVWVKSVALVQKYKPINLGQGFPDFPEVVPRTLKEALIKTQQPDADVNFNQYCRGQGHPELASALADIYGPLFERTLDPLKEIIMTVGGYEALHCTINAVTNPGDEVILIEPFFDSYSETVRICGGVARFIPLKMREGGTTSGDFVFDRDQLTAMFNDKTKAIIVNTPHNPTGKVFNLEEIQFIADLCKKHNVLYISDEVYEWLVYHGNQHIRAATLPGMWDRTVTICSAGKAFNATGWKTGWAIGPEKYITACMKIHQGIIYTIPTPLQVALAEAFRKEKELLGSKESYWYWLIEDMTRKRNRLFTILKEAGLNPIMPQGGYFMVADITPLSDKVARDSEILDAAVQEWMIAEKGIASIPVSAFFSKGHKKDNCKFIRFCFIKGDKTLDAAEEKLKLLQSHKHTNL